MMPILRTSRNVLWLLMVALAITANPSAFADAPASEATANDAPASETPAANQPATEKPANDEVWITALASGKLATPEGPKQVNLAATASGLLLRPADVVQWEGDDFAARKVLMSHPVAVWSVQVSDDGSHVASSDYRGNLQVYDVAASTPTMHTGVFERWSQAIRFAPGTDTIVAGNEGGKCFVWEVDKVAKTVEVGTHSLTDIAFSPAGDRLAISDGGGTVHLYSWPAMEPAGKIKVNESPAWCVAFSADGNSLLVGSGDRKLYRCEAKDAATPEAFVQGTDWFTRLAVSSSGAIAATEISGKVYVFENEKVAADSVKPKGTAPSSVWAVHWVSPETLLIGTRKHAVQSLVQPWTLGPAESPADDQ